MAIYGVRAIVIGRYDFGEADRILVLLTDEKGVVRAVARGVRKIKSRLAGHLELFSESDLMLAEGRNLDVLTSARLQHHLHASDYDRMRLAYLVAEMVNRLGGENEPHPGLFQLIHDTYGELVEGQPDAVLELWFKLRLLDRLGYRPELGRCLTCGTPTSANREYYFSVSLGGLVDRGCAGAEALSIGRDTIKLWRIMLDAPIAKVRLIAAASELATISLPICNAFYDYTFGKRFRSAAFPV